MEKQNKKMKPSTRSWIQFGIIVALILLATIIILSNNNSCSIHDYKGYFEEFEGLLNPMNQNIIELHHTLVDSNYIEHPTNNELEDTIREVCRR